LALLALGWSVVVASAGGRRLRRARLVVLGLSAGSFALLVLLVGGMSRAGGPAYGTADLWLWSLAPQAIALAAVARGRRDEPEGAGLASRAKAIAAGGVVAAASFVLNSTAVAASARCRFTEARAIGDLRTILSAEQVYQAANAGCYGPLWCLAAPSRCLAGYPEQAPVFLSSDVFGRPVRCGYRFTFHPGPPVTGGEARCKEPGVDRHESFCVTAVPVAPGESGVRAFCADGSGLLWVSPEGTLPPSSGGACPSGLTPLR
jgi:hypothetical protein